MSSHLVVTSLKDEKWVIDKLNQVTVVTSKENIYRECIITFINISPDSVVPTQHYCINKYIDRLKNISSALKSYNIDIFNLNGAVQYKSSDVLYTMIPPIIETTRNGENIICDGLHRLFLARTLQASCRVVLIKNCITPYYGKPNLNGWNDVVTYNSMQDFISSKRIKRLYQFDENDEICPRRDYNCQFPNLNIIEERE